MGLKKEIELLKNAVIALENGDETIAINVKNKELNELKRIFEKHLTSIIEEKNDAERKIREYEQFLAENRLMHSDRIIAEQIQKSMLPVKYPAFEEFENVDLFADMDSANETGGDFYDFFKIDDNRICFSVADIEGKGIPAAMYMAVAKTMIQLRLESGEELTKVFSDVNKELCRSSMQKRFITMWSGIMDVNSGNITYVNAGHNPPVLKRKGMKAELVKSLSGIPIASYYSKKRSLDMYKEYGLTLEKGDILILYTDGVTEAMNHNGEIFGEERLMEIIDLYTKDREVTAEELSAYIRRQVIAFANNTIQDDDITLMVLIYK